MDFPPMLRTPDPRNIGPSPIPCFPPFGAPGNIPPHSRPQIPVRSYTYSTPAQSGTPETSGSSSFTKTNAVS